MCVKVSGKCKVIIDNPCMFRAGAVYRAHLDGQGHLRAASLTGQRWL